MIEAIHLTKVYDHQLAVQDLNLQIANELFVFLGPNGAGKTTTIKMMTGLLQPTSGSVRIGGYDLATQPVEAKKMFGLVPDTPVLYDKLTLIEFLQFVARMYEMDASSFKRRFSQLVELFDLQNKVNDLIQTFSHGMKQKCVLAAALIHDPRVLFLDEPTVGLDPKSARHLKDLLRGLVKQGTTVFMSTHILEIAEAMCDRVGIIDHGQLIACGTMDELRRQSSDRDQSLEEIFLELTGGSEYDEVLKYLEDK
ncbi:MAG: ABC transporter ATP-binding protein [candidate division KSB1 bacterium]|nr:ABC transporter ATP-binding protein [candidate division KSB1 bacterium]MDZ7340309.1 ABC transporter ATP-binding protein [candidate division KSB1 bacterium]